MSDPGSKLTSETREEINRYLMRLLLALGIPNLIAIAGAFVYILFVLPKAAVAETRALGKLCITPGQVCYRRR